MTQINRNNYIYTSLFCEENIWKLIESLYMKPLAKPIEVLFIINHTNSVAIFEQNHAVNNNPVIWDYHVVLLAQIEKNHMILDFDSCCEFPTLVSTYFSLTFPENTLLIENLQPYIKAIPADYYFKHFYSDRSHMKDIINEMEYPDYPAIKPANSIDALSLSDCRNIKKAIKEFEIFTPQDYLNKKFR